MFGIQIGRMGVGVGRKSVYSPSKLFASGEQGIWLDPSDFTTMFQDSAGTTPVTADGQPVGLILDKSGNGNHASQATAAARPLYKTDGTYHWLQFDGVDDSIVSSPFSSNIVDGVTNILGLSLISIINQAVTYDGNANDSMQLYNHLATGAQRVYAATSGSSTFATLTAGSKYVMTNQFNQASGFSRVNGSQFATSTGSVNTDLIRIGRKLSTSYNNIKLFGFISRVIQLNSTEITDTETWVNRKTGAY